MGQAPAELDVTEALSAIWGEALGREGPLDPDANFYDLGGSSLVAMRIVAGAKAAGITLRARQLFLHPTLRQLTAAVIGPVNGGQ